MVPAAGAQVVPVAEVMAEVVRLVEAMVPEAPVAVALAALEDLGVVALVALATLVDQALAAQAYLVVVLLALLAVAIRHKLLAHMMIVRDNMLLQLPKNIWMAKAFSMKPAILLETKP